MNDKPTKEQTAGRPKGMTVKEVKDTTKERQVKFLEETISKLESFKQQVINGEVFIEDASMNTGHDAPTTMSSGRRNISIDIDYIGSEEHHMNKVVRNL